MLTPQAVSDRGFTKAALGGYNMAQVDEFLDIVTGDYTTLYQENTALKRKMKVMQDKIDEYRNTEETMRKALLAAQQIAENMVVEGQKKSKLLMDEARHEIESLRKSTLDERKMEENRLLAVKQVTSQYVEQVKELHRKEMDYLDSLGTLVTSETVIPDSTEPVAPTRPQEEVEQPPPPKAQSEQTDDVQMLLQRAMADALGEKKAAELSEENYGTLQHLYQNTDEPQGGESIEATTRFLLRTDLENAQKPAQQLAEDMEYDAELARSGSRLDFSRLQQEFGPNHNNNNGR